MESGFGKLSATARGGTGGPRGNRPFAGPHTRFNDTVAAERSFAGFSLRLDAMRRVARSCDATLNDVVLAVVDAGVERLLAALGPPQRRRPPPRALLSPANLRCPRQAAALRLLSMAGNPRCPSLAQPAAQSTAAQ